MSPDGKKFTITNSKPLEMGILYESKSNASFKISEVKGIIYGGCSSRFWMLRKHINSLPKKEHKNLPFHAWECLTIQLVHRNVDLVIRSEKEMSMLLKILVTSLETIDGTTGTARPILQ